MFAKRAAGKGLTVFLAISLLLFLASCRVSPSTDSASGPQQAAQTNAVKTPVPTPEITPAPTPTPSHDPVGDPSSPILERALDKVPFSLIDGRLLIQMPLGAQDEALQRGIMSASPSNRAETRLMLESGGQELVVFTQESFYYTDNLQNDLDRILKARYGTDFAYTADAARQAGGITVIPFSPNQLDTSTDTVLVRGAVVQLADKSFLTLSVYATPATVADKELCLKQADAILGSIQPGTRTIDTSAHEQRLGENIIYIQLDEGYELVQDEGADFSVFYLMKFVKFGEPASSIGIYVGSYPSMQYASRGIGESQLTTVKDRILNKNVEWKTYKVDPAKDAFSGETAFHLNSSLIMHIFVDAANEAEFENIKAMIHTLKIK